MVAARHRQQRVENTHGQPPGGDHARTTTAKPPFLAYGTLGEISPF